MEKTIIEILKKASDFYYNSENFYEMSDDEVKSVVEDLQIPCQSLMTDAMFDEIYSKAKEKYSTNPYFLSVGSEVRGGKVKLPIQLGSMTEVKEGGELQKWLVPATEYCISDKLDGCSCLLVYEDSKLKIAYSRGDGFNGQDITRTVKQLSNVPKELQISFTGFIRGEIIIPRNDIQNCINELKEETGKEYKNGRNLTAGQLNAETANKAFIKYAHFVAYNIYNHQGTTSFMFRHLEHMGFETPEYMVCNDLYLTDDNIREYIKQVKLDNKYECDGVICTMEEIDDDHQGFETGTLNPKNSRKIKFGLKDFGTKECEVIGISWQISKNYKLKPVININPVEINGSTVSNITGNNFKFIVDNDICIGSKGLFAKNGDVIPGWIKTTYSPLQYFDKVKENIFENWEDDILDKLFKLPLPKSCLYLDGVDLVLDEYNADDSHSCMSQYKAFVDKAELQQVLYFCVKLGVDFAGEGNLMKLSEHVGHIISYENLVLLPREVFEEVIGVNGLKLYDSLHKKVENATPTQLADATGCFGDGIGELKLNKIVDKYGDLPYDREKVLNTDGWAETSTDQYISHYASYINMVQFFQENDMWKGFTIIEATGDKCKDVKVVFTGIRSAEMEDVIRKNGGKVLSSFTKECNLVIAKDPMGNSGKLQKARDNGVEVISLEEAFERFGHKEESKIDQNLDNPLVNKLLGK